MTERSLESDLAPTGLADLFGVAVQSAQRDRVTASMRIAPDHLTADGAVYGGVLTALADCVSAHGTTLSLPTGYAASAIDTQAKFLRRGEGESLDAIATPLHTGRTTSVWRTVIRRGKGRPIAEITQTHLILPKKPERRRPVLVASNTTADSPPVSEERKRQIFEGASRVIAEKGFASASIRDIAAAAGMPVPTMYQYIERKEDLLFLIYESFLQDYAESLRRAVEAAPSPSEKLQAAVATTLDNFDRNHAYIKLMFQETRALSPEGRRRVFELDARYIRVWTSILSGITERKSGAEPELLANLIYFLCTVWPLRYWTIGKFGRSQVEAAITSLLKGGLGLGAQR